MPYLPLCDSSLEGYSLVASSVSFGNVGQIAVDVLINTGLKQGLLKKIGVFHSLHLLPVVCGDPFNGNDRSGDEESTMCYPCELFTFTKRKICILQIRSCINTGHMADFVKDLFAWIKESKFSSLLLLSGADARYRSDRLIRAKRDAFCLRTEASSPFLGSLSMDELDKETEAARGTGICLAALAEAEACSLPTCGLIRFVDEGDNRFDGYTMASVVLKHVPALAEVFGDAKLCPPASLVDAFAFEDDTPDEIY